jgi:hypothetical protein
MYKFVCLFVLLSLTVSAQEKENNLSLASKEKKAFEILENARKAQNVKLDEIKSLSINYEKNSSTVFNERKIEKNLSSKLDISFPDKIIQENTGNYSTNKEVSSFKINGDLFSYKTDLYKNDGEKIYFDPYTGDKSDLILSIKRDSFYAFFPITLDTSWFFKFSFSYVGIAQSANQKANVIEGISKSGTKYQLFFDEKTNLILMMIKSWKDKSENQITQKYFYSDFKEFDGLYFSTKVKVEQNNSIIEEQTIKSVKVNPKFKDNFFDVKK